MLMNSLIRDGCPDLENLFRVGLTGMSFQSDLHDAFGEDD